MFKEYIKPLIVLTGICLFFAAALALVNNVTAPVISQAAEQRAYEAMYLVLPESDGFIQIDYEFDAAGSVREAYRAKNGVGYVFITSVTGYSGQIRIICAMSNDGEIIAVKTLSHTETVGIGTIIEQASFTSQFAGKDSALSGVDTVTGATVSTSAFIRAIEGVFDVFEAVR